MIKSNSIKNAPETKWINVNGYNVKVLADSKLYSEYEEVKPKKKTQKKSSTKTTKTKKEKKE